MLCSLHQVCLFYSDDWPTSFRCSTQCQEIYDSLAIIRYNCFSLESVDLCGLAMAVVDEAK